jgi:predicted ArsR family transcriptional regulator
MPTKKTSKTPSPLFDRVQSALNDVRSIERPTDSFTLKEYQDELKISQNAARTRLATLVQAGKLRKVRVPVIDASGRRQILSGYQLIDDGGKG